jgi:hypothetical protein
MKEKLDKKWVGIATGLILPIIAFLLFWYFKYGEKSAEQLWDYMTSNSENRNDLLIFHIPPNLVVFYFTNFQWRLDQFTTGIVGTTILLTIPVVIALIY